MFKAEVRTIPGRVDREKQTVNLMITLYCRRVHQTPYGLCPNCYALLNYAFDRLERCTYGEGKPVCGRCPIHCYKPEMRQQILDVMRFSGPRMVIVHPVAAIRHFLDKYRPQKRR